MLLVKFLFSQNRAGQPFPELCSACEIGASDLILPYPKQLVLILIFKSHFSSTLVRYYGLKDSAQRDTTDRVTLK